MIPFLDLKKINQSYYDEMTGVISDVVRSGWYILGERVKSFENSIVGAGSVVTKDVPGGMVVVGNPAKIIKEKL